MERTPRVLLTRAAGDNGLLASALDAGGAVAVEVPLVRYEPTGRSMPPAAASDLAVFTSPRAVEHGGVAWLGGARVAAVGPSTARALRAAGCPPEIVPAGGTAAHLAASLGDLSGTRVLYPRAERVPAAFEDALRAAGADLVAVPVYRNSCPPGARAALADALPVDAAAVASGSAGRRLAALAPELGSALVVAIGPSTAAACRRAGLHVDAVAKEHDARGLARAVLAALGLGS